MKYKIICGLIFGLLIACFAGEIRQSESGFEPAKLRYLQGGVLIAWDIEKDTVVDEYGSRVMYRYQEVLIRPGDTIPAGVPIDELGIAISDFAEMTGTSEAYIDSLGMATGEEVGSIGWIIGIITALGLGVLGGSKLKKSS